MHIDSYQFGRIVIDGCTYTTDVIICGGEVMPDWWRKQGHLLTAADLKEVLAARPSMLVVGCGASGEMRIAEDARRVLEENGIKLEVYDTGSAVERFNELANLGENVAAALHLTC